MICYSRSITDRWRNRRTEERERWTRLGRLGGMWDRMEEKMGLGGFWLPHTSLLPLLLLHGLGTDVCVGSYVSMACTLPGTVTSPLTHPKHPLTVPLNPIRLYAKTDGIPLSTPTQPALWGPLVKPDLVFQSRSSSSCLLFRPRPSPCPRSSQERWNVDGLVDPYRGLLP